MKANVVSTVLGFALAATLLSACGKEESKTPRRRDAMPLVRLTLKNTSPAGGHPATATATGSMDGRAAQPLAAGPVEPGQMNSSAPLRADEGSDANSVAVTVTFLGGSTFHATGTYVGSFVTSVDVEAGEPAGGTVTVNFGSGQPSQSIPLTP